MAALAPASIASLYDRAIQGTGREPEFLFLLAFLGSFGFIRTSAHLIRAEVSWWPGNVEVGGTHIHHLVWGILLLLIFGYVGAVMRPGEPWTQISVVAFGIGAGLTLDEFALWLNLRDVYWEREGRRSVDAVIVAALLAATAVIGFGAWVELADDVETYVFALIGSVGAISFALGLVNCAKEKFGLAAIGVLVPFVSLAGAVRLAKPGSMWAHHLYGPQKARRAELRFGSDDAQPGRAAPDGPSGSEHQAGGR